MLTETIKNFLNLCTRCGKCVPVCPSYQVYKNEAFSPRGRIFYLLKEIDHETFNFCLMCERCSNVCPNEISFPQVYMELSKDKKNSFLYEKFLENFISDPFRIFVEFNHYLHFIPLNSLETTRNFENISFEQGDITIYYSCDLRYLYPQVLNKFDDILKKYNIKAHMPVEVKCCGAPFLNLGCISLFKRKALENLTILEKTKGPIIMFCASCLWIFKKVYPVIFKASSYESRFQELAKRVVSGYRFLSENACKELKKLKNQKNHVIFHLPCHLTEDFNLVKNIIEVKSFCCGSPKISLWLKEFQQKYKKNWIQELNNTKTLATFCAGCYLNFNLLVKKPPQIRHWFEFL